MDAQVEKAKNDIEKFKKVNSEIPEEIKPEYIYGCSKKQRDEKFEQLFNALERMRGYYLAKIIDLNNIINYIDENNLRILALKIQQISNNIDEIKLKQKDEWHPALLFEEYEEIKTEKILKNVDENTVKIILEYKSKTKNISDIKDFNIFFEENGQKQNVKMKKIFFE